ncbi:MAG: thiamine-phosphate kinase [Verrucomicrobiaceae bacterium]|nr:thiamine-phosphate kinase [Verrucomicrobiaceae bacterium]
MAERDQKLADIGEDALVQSLVKGLETRSDVAVAAGDDCALIRGGKRGHYLLLKTDCVIEGVHYSADTPPSRVGYKALARAISDIAAMAGKPQHALVTLILQANRKTSYARAIYRGLTRAAQQHDIAIVGGETACPPGNGTAMVSVALTGIVGTSHCCLRSGGKPGDVLFVTGKLGGSLKGHHLRFEPRVAQAAWLACNFKPRAMMDLSDGLAADLPRLADASGCGYRIDVNALPCRRGCSTAQALNDGEDYELLFALPPRHAENLALKWGKRFPKLPLSRIGTLTKPGILEPRLAGGWQHF